MKQRVKSQKIRKAVIPVAGFGTRFLPATIAQPKEMLTVVDKPVIQYIVEEMVASGIEEIVFVTGRNKRAIEDHFDYSSELEQMLRDGDKMHLLKEIDRISQLAKFVYVRQNKMLGNGHALLMAREVIGDEPFAFSYGDDIIESRVPAIKQLIGAYNQKKATIIGTMPVEEQLAHRFGIVSPVGGIKSKTFAIKEVIEKPQGKPPSRFANFGKYIFTPDIFEYLAKAKPSRGGELYIADAVNLMAKKRPVFAHHMIGEYFDCGNKLEYIKANIHFAIKHPELRQDVREFIRHKI